MRIIKKYETPDGPINQNISLQDYIAQKIQEVRDSAVNVMNTRKYPRVFFNSSPEYIAKYIDENQHQIEVERSKMAKVYQDLSKGLYEGQEEIAYDLIRDSKKKMEDYRHNVDLVCKHNKAPQGASCLFTVTDSYGKERAVPGNLTWLAKGKSGRPIYEEKGFKLVKLGDNPIQGDIIQLINSDGTPQHAIMYMSEAENSQDWEEGHFVKATYSNGDYGKEAIRRNENMPYWPKHDNLFRFVGNAADSARWIRI